MSLLVWLPLTGDIHNQGLLNVTTSAFGSLTYEDGKIGQAVRIGSGNGTVNKGVEINSNLITNLGTEYSCSVWVKPTGNHTNYEGCIISSGNWNTNTWSFGLNQTNTQVSVMQRGYNNYIACDVPVNTWTHLVSTAKNGVAKLYKNGVYIGSKNIANPELISDANFTRIGNASYTNYFTFNGLISDVRIYNEELSPKQIKLLSQGLVLHYTLSMPIRKNLIDKDNVTANGYINSSGGITGTSGWYYTDYIPVKPNTNYIGSSISKGGANTCIGLYNSSKTFTRTIVITANVNPTFTTTASEVFVRCSIRNLANELATAQLEEGTVATAYAKYIPPIPGADDGIEYDVSGFGNNGTKVGTIIYDSDTPKYWASSHFNSSSAIKNNTFAFTSGQWTASCWYKMTATSSSYQSFFCLSRNSGADADKKFAAMPIESRIWFKIENQSYTLQNSLTLNTWNLITITSDGSNGKVYINGELKYTSGSITSIFTDCDDFVVGARANAQNASALSVWYNGNISDVRIYATALSADDILELYNTPVHLTSNGALITSGEITEG